MALPQAVCVLTKEISCMSLLLRIACSSEVHPLSAIALATAKAAVLEIELQDQQAAFSASLPPELGLILCAALLAHALPSQASHDRLRVQSVVMRCKMQLAADGFCE